MSTDNIIKRTKTIEESFDREAVLADNVPVNSSTVAPSDASSERVAAVGDVLAQVSEQELDAQIKATEEALKAPTLTTTTSTTTVITSNSNSTKQSQADEDLRVQRLLQQSAVYTHDHKRTFGL
jgi:hypothetical protein